MIKKKYVKIKITLLSSRRAVSDKWTIISQVRFDDYFLIRNITKIINLFHYTNLT